MCDDNVTEFGSGKNGVTPETMEAQINNEMVKAKNERFKVKLKELLSKKAELQKSLSLIEEQVSELKSDYAKNLI